MNNYEALLKIFENEIRAARDYLEYSHQKIQNLPSDPLVLTADTLETWESYLARFARVTDIFLSKYLRTLAQQADPAFRGELRDYVDKAEKNGVVSDANQWMVVRELRNKIAHEYSRSELKRTFEDVKRSTPFILKELRKVFP